MKIAMLGVFEISSPVIGFLHIEKSPPPTSFSPVTSTNIGISPQNFPKTNPQGFGHIY